MWCWELKSGPLKEHPMLFTTETSFQTQKYNLTPINVSCNTGFLLSSFYKFKVSNGIMSSTVGSERSLLIVVTNKIKFDEPGKKKKSSDTHCSTSIVVHPLPKW